MEKKEKVLLVHSGRRDSYEVALALSHEFDVTLLTDFYYRPNSFIGFLAKIIFGESVNLRCKKSLQCSVVTSFTLLVLDYLNKFFPRNTFIFKSKARSYEVKAKRLLQKHKFDYVFFYSNHGSQNIFKTKFNKTKKILFQMHPHPDLTLDIYRMYLLKRPDLFKELTEEEEEFAHDESYISSIKDEAHSSDLVICTTSFTKLSLLSAGINEKKILVIPYGVVVKKNKKEIESVTQSKYSIRLAFVGQFVVRKGIYELIEAVRNNNKIKLNIYTRDVEYASKKILNKYGVLYENIEIKHIEDDKLLWREVSNLDFLILPSLVEGFGHVILQSLSVGVPVVSSINTAAADLIDNYVDGVVLNELNAHEILKCIRKLIRLKSSWKQMRIAALSKAKNYSWRTFREKIKKGMNE